MASSKSQILQEEHDSKSAETISPQNPPQNSPESESPLPFKSGKRLSFSPLSRASNIKKHKVVPEPDDEVEVDNEDHVALDDQVNNGVDSGDKLDDEIAEEDGRNKDDNASYGDDPLKNGVTGDEADNEEVGATRGDGNQRMGSSLAVNDDDTILENGMSAAADGGVDANSEPEDDMEKEKGLPEEEKKIQITQGKIWSDADVIVLLQGMIKFREEMNRDPYTDANVFHGFLENAFSSGFTTKQLKNKMESLKKKFNAKIAAEENRGGVIFAKPHDSRVFYLSKKIWGAVIRGAANKKGKSSVMDAVKTDKSSLGDSRKKDKGDPNDGLEEGEISLTDGPNRQFGKPLTEYEILNNGWKYLSSRERAMQAKRWEELEKMEEQALYTRYVLIRDQMEMTIKAQKSCRE